MTQGLNPCLLCLLPWQADSLPLHHLGSPVQGAAAAAAAAAAKSLQSCLTLCDPRDGSPELYYNLNFLSHEMGQLRSNFIMVIKSTYIRAKPPGSKPRLVPCEHDLGQCTPPSCVLVFSYGNENDNSHSYFQASNGYHKHQMREYM